MCFVWCSQWRKNFCDFVAFTMFTTCNIRKIVSLSAQSNVFETVLTSSFSNVNQARKKVNANKQKINDNSKPRNHNIQTGNRTRFASNIAKHCRAMADSETKRLFPELRSNRKIWKIKGHIRKKLWIQASIVSRQWVWRWLTSGLSEILAASVFKAKTKKTALFKEPSVCT
jgi:hypothetical protein